MPQTLLNFWPRRGRRLKYGAPSAATKSLVTTKHTEREVAEKSSRATRRCPELTRDLSPHASPEVIMLDSSCCRGRARMARAEA
jgi:hypothetical protein